MHSFRKLFLSLLFPAMIASVAPAAEPQKTSSLSSLPLEDQVAISTTIGKDSSAFYARATAGTVEMQDSAGTMKATFTDDGARLRTPGGNWGLHFLGYGRANHTISAEEVAPSAEANRVEYRRGTLTEWYENGPSGLEQGFTLDRSSQIERLGELTIVLGLSGDFDAVVDQDGHGLSLLDRTHRSRLRYSGLQAYDVNHNALPAIMAVDGNRLLIRVDDRKAKYPVTVDPIVQLAELTASDGQANDDLGFSVAVSGNTVVVGAPSASIGGNIAAGAAYVFVKPASGWASETQTAKLTASDGTTSDQMGWSVAVSGNTVVVGAPNTCVGFTSKPGKAYVFVEPSSGWTDMTQTAELTATDSVCLGVSVGLSGNTVALGAQYTSSALQNAGAAYVYVKPSGGWKNMTQTAKLTASDAVAGDRLGYAVGLSGTTIVASAPFKTTGPFVLGELYVYEQPSGGWIDSTENAHLTSSNSISMGLSLAIAGTTVVAGDPNNSDGAAFVYVEPGGGWVTTSTYNAELTASNATGRIQFGWSVATAGKHIVVGANKAASSKGTVYIYTEPAGGWMTTSQFTAQLHASDSVSGAQFGNSVSISGSTIAIGANHQTIGSNLDQGAAYVF